MAILTHGSDLTLAPTIRPVVRQAGVSVRQAVDYLSAAGFSAVQLDAALPGLRPRDLDLRARKDLIAMLTRQDMRLAGLDLFIPRRHYLQPDHIDRAMSATLAALELAADLGRVPLSIALPVKTLGEDVKRTLVEGADGRGVRLAVHAEDQIDDLLAWVNAVDVYALGAALDPAAVLGRGGDPSAVVHKLGRRLAVARLCDLGMTDGEPAGEGDDEAVRGAGIRSVVGEGDLDLTGYRISLDLATARTGPVVLDLRGMENPQAGAAAGRAAWEHAAFKV